MFCKLILRFTFIFCPIFATPTDFSVIASTAISSVVGIQTDNSQGSGFFIRDDGYILTNSHLLENATTIEVITFDKQILPAQVIQLDLNTDLAVIKVEGSGFPYLAFGDPNKTEIGDLVLSIGYPDSFERGLVKDKDITHIGLFPTENFIKTSAFIFLGDSGGPLLNLSGDVIGINAAALIDSTGKYLGESLAISNKLLFQKND